MDTGIKVLGGILLAAAVVLGLVALWNNVIKAKIETKITDEIDDMNTSYVMPSAEMELPTTFYI